ncbi:SAM-dependent methyltransferase [Streptomyces vietnamensis]|uniref:SAM-dependent methyltransferase n=1 Tax=Streptomyces vietnamensis TaxID=362257 RepID=UPI0006977B0C|nr:class I SAM-dependent methyltransferase [Streptomyces vietnamensis]
MTSGTPTGSSFAAIAEEWDSYQEIPAIDAAYEEALGDQFAGQFSGATPDYLERLATRLGWSPLTRVLDAGCGTGGLTAALAARTGCEAVGLDASPAAVGVARARLAGREEAGRVTYAVGDMADPGFPARSFDAVLSIGSGYWSDPVTTTRRWRELLRGEHPAVVLVISRVLRPQSPRDVELTLQKGLFTPCPDWEGALSAAGFDIETTDLTESDADCVERLHGALARRLPELRTQMGEEAGERYLAEVEVLRDEHRAGRMRRTEIVAVLHGGRDAG